MSGEPTGNWDQSTRDALVKYQAYDGYEGNTQVVETDASGVCEVEEYLLAGKDAVLDAAIAWIGKQ